MINITSTELKAIVDKGITEDNSILIDLRPKAEFKEGHIKGSKNVDLSELIENTDYLFQFKNIYLICNNGTKSETGQYMLRNLNFRNVVNVKDGINGWKRKGFELTTDV